MIDRLNVLILGINFTPEVTGIAPYTTGIAHGLAAEGHRVRVMTGFPHYPAWEFSPGYEKGWRRWERQGDVAVVRLRHPLPTNSLGPKRVLMESVFAAQAAVGGMRRPDLILVMSPALLTVGAALARRFGRRTAVGAIAQDLYCRAFAETGALDGRGGKLVSRLERGLLSRADGVAVIHQRFVDTLASIGVPRELITVIRNWTHITPSAADRERTRVELGWRPDETIVLHAGNMGHKQGLENVVDAASLASRRRDPVRFVLLGDGARRQALVEAGRGVENLEFLAPLPEGRFEDALAAADLLLLNEKPGVSDMCVPGKLTSYFAAGRPVVAATDPNSGAAAEIVAAGAGHIVSTGEPELLLKAVTMLADDPVASADMGERGRDYAAAMLTPEAAIRSYAAWATGLVRARRGSAPFAEELSPIPSAR